MQHRWASDKQKLKWNCSDRLWMCVYVRLWFSVCTWTCVYALWFSWPFRSLKISQSSLFRQSLHHLEFFCDRKGSQFKARPLRSFKEFYRKKDRIKHIYQNERLNRKSTSAFKDVSFSGPNFLGQIWISNTHTVSIQKYKHSHAHTYKSTNTHIHRCKIIFAISPLGVWPLTFGGRNQGVSSNIFVSLEDLILPLA